MNDTSFFDYEQFMPHGMCYLWQPDILWTSVISDVVTAIGYYSIMIAIIVFIKQRKDIAYPWFFRLIGIFVFGSCGTGHLITAIVIWEPIYGISAVVKAVTAVVSIFAGTAIWLVIPFFVRLPSPSRLERKNQALQESLEKLRLAQNQVLESERLASLNSFVTNLANELNSPLKYALDQSLQIQRGLKVGVDELKGAIINKQLTTDCNNALDNLHRCVDIIERFKHIGDSQEPRQKYSINLYDYIQDLFCSLELKFEMSRFNVTFDCPEDLIIQIRPSAIINIVTNLVSNSVYHGFSGSEEGTIELSIIKETNDSLLFRYSDDGWGMSETQVSQIFNPFYKSTSSGSQQKLGMAIIQNTVEALNGKINCVSKQGEGTTFILHIPFSEIKSETLITEVPPESA